MSNFITLAKVFFFSGFQTNSKKKNQKSALMMLFAFSAGFLVISVFLNYYMSQAFSQYNLYNEYLSLMIGVSAILTFIMSMFQMQSVIFKTADYEMLESLPVRKPTIVSAKIFAVYLINLLEDAIIALPAVVIYMIYTNNPIGLLGIPGIILASFIPLTLSTLIGLLTAVVTAKSKYASIISIVISVLFFGAFFVGYMFLIYSKGDALLGVVDSVFILRWVKEGLYGDYLKFLYFVLLNVGCAALVIGGVSLLYRPINSWLLSGGAHTEYKGEKKDSKVKSLDKVLLAKEWQMLYRKTNYLVNSYLGPFFFIALGLFFTFGYRLFINGVTNPDEIEATRRIFMLMIPAMGIMMTSITTSTSGSISFEKREGFELLNTYPVSPAKVIRAKLSIGIICGVVTALTASTIILICQLVTQNFNPVSLIALVLLPLGGSIATAFVGMVCGLKWPKLDFENEMQVLKNSAAANFTLLFSMLLGLLKMGIYITCVILSVFSPNLSFLGYIGLAGSLLVDIVIVLVCYFILKNDGNKMYYRILKK